MPQPKSSSRPIQPTASSSSRPLNATAARPTTTANQQQQPPWRSSLDLVWSYSRSQAFYANNLETSPSFTDDRWRGPQPFGLTPEALEEGDEEDYEWDEEDDEYAEAEEPQRRRGSSMDDFLSHSGPVWSDESHEQRSSGNSTPRHRDVARVANDPEGSSGEDRSRSRSRSRSPKQLGMSRGGSGSRTPSSLSRATSLEGEDTNQRRSSRSGSRRPSELDTTPRRIASERTPLLAGQRQVSDRRRTSRSSVVGGMGRRKSSGTHAGKLAAGMIPQGSSTFGQSLFNCINALVGVGILSLPLALSYSSLTLGIPIFLAAGLLTSYTGKLLWKMMLLDPRLRTYADIGRFAFGDRAQLGIGLLFGAELWAVSVALIILFGDSLFALVHSSHGTITLFAQSTGIMTWSPNAFKMLGCLLVLPTVFMPLRLLSPISVVGILSTLTLLIILITDGSLKTEAPGSLRDPAVSLWPPETPQWGKFPLAFGLIMSGFSAHPIIPSLVRDMREPHRFPAMLNTAYMIATAIYLSMGIVGYLMFGRGVSDEITKDMAHVKEYPPVLTKVAVWLIVIVPLTKFALASRPVMGIFEGLAGVEEQINLSAVADSPGPAVDGENGEVGLDGTIKAPVTMPAPNVDEAVGQSSSNFSLSVAPPGTISTAPPRFSGRTRTILRQLLRLALTALILLTAIVFPEFEKMMAFLGALLASLTCVIGPVLAHMKLFHTTLSTTRIICEVALLSVTIVCAIMGTIWAFLPM